MSDDDEILMDDFRRAQLMASSLAEPDDYDYWRARAVGAEAERDALRREIAATNVSGIFNGRGWLAAFDIRRSLALREASRWVTHRSLGILRRDLEPVSVGGTEGATE